MLNLQARPMCQHSGFLLQGTATQFGGPGKVGAAAISDALDMTIALIRVLGRSKLPHKLQRHALPAGDLSSGQVGSPGLRARKVAERTSRIGCLPARQLVPSQSVCGRMLCHR